MKYSNYEMSAEGLKKYPSSFSDVKVAALPRTYKDMLNLTLKLDSVVRSVLLAAGRIWSEDAERASRRPSIAEKRTIMKSLVQYQYLIKECELICSKSNALLTEVQAKWILRHTSSRVGSFTEGPFLLTDNYSSNRPIVSNHVSSYSGETPGRGKRESLIATTRISGRVRPRRWNGSTATTAKKQCSSMTSSEKESMVEPCYESLTDTQSSSQLKEDLLLFAQELSSSPPMSPHSSDWSLISQHSDEEFMLLTGSGSDTLSSTSPMNILSLFSSSDSE